MRLSHLVFGAALAANTPAASAQQDAFDRVLSMTEAMEIAERVDPQARLREAQLIAAGGTLRDAAATLYNNPEITFGSTRRSQMASGDSVSEWNVGVAQTFETGGQSLHRRAAATADIRALQAELVSARRLARSSAALRYVEVLAAQRRVQIEKRSVELFEETARAVAKRKSAGEGTRLEANVALIEAERAKNALQTQQERLLGVRSDLATQLQMAPDSLPLIVGELKQPTGEVTSALDAILASALALPQLEALAERQNAAKERLELEYAVRYPDLTLSLDMAREGADIGRERATTLSISLPLPLFKRNDAAIGRALADTQQAEIERSVAARDAQALVRTLWGRYKSQRARIERIVGAMIPASDDSQRLVGRSRQSGQIGLLDQLIVNRQALDAERDLAEALAEIHSTRIELERAAGLPIGAIQ